MQIFLYLPKILNRCKESEIATCFYSLEHKPTLPQSLWDRLKPTLILPLELVDPTAIRPIPKCLQPLSHRRLS